MALVLFNAVNAALVLGAVNNNSHPILPIGGQQLAPWCHGRLQQAVLALPGRNVAFVRGRITPEQVRTHRPSYINALLIQSRGVVQQVVCTECRRRGLSPFPECIMVAEHFGGACGNCKWRDYAARYSFPQNLQGSNEDDSGDDSDEPVIVRVVQRRPALGAPIRRGLLEAGDGSHNNPLVIN